MITYVGMILKILHRTKTLRLQQWVWWIMAQIVCPTYKVFIHHVPFLTTGSIGFVVMFF